MIIQRIAKSLSLQHWSTALLEILIVVIGIFLGLQVDDWNQQRKDRGDEKEFLNSLHDDLLVADEECAWIVWSTAFNLHISVIPDEYQISKLSL